MAIRILAIGDIVGTPGRKILREQLAEFRVANDIDFVVANCENVVSGSGVTVKIMEKLLVCEIDVLTSGDHIWRRMEIANALIPNGRLIRPVNYPDNCPGRGITIIESKKGVKVAVLNALGRLFMNPIDCPYNALEKAVAEARRETPVVLIDFHAEATSEKIALGWYLDGKVSCIWGTHTHVQTADERVLPKGTAYITDLGMTGSHRSVLGREVAPVLQKMIEQLPARFDVADGDIRMSGIIVTVEESTGKALGIERVQLVENE